VTGRGERHRDDVQKSFVRVCSAAVVALMVIDSVVGLFVHGVYHEARWAIAALRGNDLVTLVLVVPVLALAVARADRSPRWQLLWFGGLLYGVYNFAYYAFGTTFNDVFLLHVATLNLSIVALIALAMRIDVGQLPVGQRHDRVIAGYMIVVGAALLLAWGGLSLRFAVTGELPHDVMPPSAVHLVYALDMSLLAPAFLAGGILLWRRQPWGTALGVAVNAFGAAYLVVLEFVGGFEANAGIADKTWMSPPAIGGAILCSAAVASLLHRIGPAARPAADDLRPYSRQARQPTVVA
jgi:hypothetical protein